MFSLRSGFLHYFGWQWGVVFFIAGTMNISQAQSFRLESAGVRGGLSPSEGAGHNFHQVEAFVNCNLPWRWDLGAEWWLQSRLDLSAGWLGSSFDSGFVGTLGPSLLLGRERFPLSFAIGFSPTLLSRHDFHEKDFGQRLQFTSHIGFNYDISQHFRAGYRFQHMSNADLNVRNPGLNLHMFAFSYLF